MKTVPIYKALFISSLLSAIVGSITVLPFINPILSGFFLITVIVSIIEEKEKRYIENRTILNIVSVFGALFFLSTLSMSNLIRPITETLIFLLSVKLVERKTERDFYQIFTLSLFLFTASSIFLLNVKFLFLFLAETVITITGLILLTFLSENREITLSKTDLFKIFQFGLSFVTISIPITVLFFLILPRTQAPLFNLMPKSSTGITGFSNSVNLGTVKNIQETNAIFMRVRTKKLRENPYFRSITFEKFKNNRWTHIKTPPSKIKLKGKRIYQTVILEPYRDKYLPLLNVPLQISGIKAKKENNFFVSPKRITKRVKYSGISVITNNFEETLNEKDKEIYLSIPPLPKIENFIRKRFGNISKEKLPKEILLFLRKNFKYSLSALPGSLKEFFLKNPRGNCEYFASAATIIFRTKKIPARLVAGFYSAEFNPYGNYYIVRGKNAHIWVEYYMNGKWHHFEPTFGIPQQKERKNRTEENTTKKETSFKEKIPLIFDTLNYYFINAIINYDFNTQIKTLSNLGKPFREKKLPSFPHLKKIVSTDTSVYVVSTIFIFTIMIIFVKSRKTPVEEFYEAMKKQGYTKKHNEPLETFVKRIKNPELRTLGNEFATIYQRNFYKDKTICCKTAEKLREIISKIKKGGQGG